MSTQPVNPPAGWPQISPALFYEDAPAALEWLAKAFGCATRIKVENPEGGIVHSELELGAGIVMVSSVNDDHANPNRKAKSPKMMDGAFSQGLYVFVDDIDAHCERARAAGAVILQEPVTQDYGDRTYGAEDCEGHRWWFGQRVKN